MVKYKKNVDALVTRNMLVEKLLHVTKCQYGIIEK